MAGRPVSMSPFRRVALLGIPKQNAEGRMGIAENLAFNFWHSLPECWPRGSINRSQLVICEIISDFRRKMNGMLTEEPMAISLSHYEQVAQPENITNMTDSPRKLPITLQISPSAFVRRGLRRNPDTSCSSLRFCTTHGGCHSIIASMTKQSS
jgi:hypothetical protein